MARRIWRVLPHEPSGRWQVRRDGAVRATKTFGSQSDANEAAREIAEANQPSRVVVHGSDWSVQEREDFGESAVPSYAGTFAGPGDLGLRSEKYLAEHFSRDDAS